VRNHSEYNQRKYLSDFDIMDTSIFTDKAIIPDDLLLIESLGDLHPVWMGIRDYVFNKYPSAMEEWNFPGQKYGWNFRIKDKKRAIIYLLPRDKYFFVAFVFGEKATKDALDSNIASGIKTTIESARVCAEGRGFRIEVRNGAIIDDIKTLIDIKLKY
jgi:hypothetical protein